MTLMRLYLCTGKSYVGLWREEIVINIIKVPRRYGISSYAGPPKTTRGY
jgi:hypothetical protein